MKTSPERAADYLTATFPDLAKTDRQEVVAACLEVWRLMMSGVTISTADGQEITFKAVEYK